tara:strand:+ start:157 stop:1524 length:1368 start_codon:yes stop_codon:yes gene_type:complete
MCSFIFTNFEIEDLESVNWFSQKRGPDLTTKTKVENNYFIHNLLSITGETKPQPIKNSREDIFSIYNGEVYNYKDLKKDAASDGEVIIEQYEKLGEEAFRRLDGEFAIVLVDYTQRFLYLCTDNFATKPMWMARDKNRYCISSYESVLKNLGFENRTKISENRLVKFDLDTMNIISVQKLREFDINNQHKKTFDDWILAFENSIRKRTESVRETIFIGLSGGYDSGAIACELMKGKVPFKAYSIRAQENEDVILERHKVLENHYREYEGEVIYLSENEFSTAKRNLKQNAEEFLYQIKRNGIITPNEYMTDDKGSVGLSFICEKASSEGRKIYLSGQGADEIFSDYGFGGRKIYNHSTIGGYFPADIGEAFPWNNFYKSTQYSYLGKEENVPGAWGIEGRYPFLDFQVVQEFLWLAPELKNSKYKSPIQAYLEANNFPFTEGEKVGFSCDRNLRK